MKTSEDLASEEELCSLFVSLGESHSSDVSDSGVPGCSRQGRLAGREQLFESGAGESFSWRELAIFQ